MNDSDRKLDTSDSRFDIPVQSASVLQRAEIVDNISQDMQSAEVCPVIFDTGIHHFHDADGGYNKDTNQYIIGLRHLVESKGSPPSTEQVISEVVEIHGPNNVFTLDVDDVVAFNTDYPDNDFVISLAVGNYEMSEYTFHEQLLSNVDKRETEVSYE
jgi:hypothetical protein